MSVWRAWDWDWTTAAWVAWMAAFVVLETVTLAQGKGEELTAHLRPVFNQHLLVYLLAWAATVWLQVHFLLPALERWVTSLTSQQ